MPASQSFRQLSGLLVLSVLVLAFTGLFGVWYANERANAAMTHAGHLSDLIDSAHETQIDFKTQVQLWKNILLRGQTEEGMKTYLERFDKQDAVVRDSLAKILTLPELPADVKAELESIQHDHDTLEDAYLKALQAYVVGDQASVFRVDESVRGVDQKLNARIDAVADKLSVVKEEKMAELRKAAESQYANLRTVMLIVSVIAGLVAIVVGVKAVRVSSR